MPAREDSSDAESNGRDSGSDSEGKGGGSGSSSSSRSGSPVSQGVAPTPGSPTFGSPRSVQSARSQQSGSPRSDRSQSRPASGQSGRSPSPDSRPGSVQSHHSASSSRSAQSVRSGTPQSHRSGSPQYVASERAESHHSGSPASNRSGSVASKHSRSSKSRSKSPQSQASESPRSEHSKSGPGSNVQSPGSHASYAQSRSPSPTEPPAENAAGHDDEHSGTEHKDSDHEDGTTLKSVSKGDREASPKGKSDNDLESGDEDDRKRKHSSGTEDSGSDTAVRSRKKRAVLDSDSDGEATAKPQRALAASGSEEEDATAAALFGDADDISSDEDDKKGKSPRRGSDAGSGDEKPRSRDASRERSRSRSRSRDRSRDGSDEDRVARGDEEEKEVEEPPPETRIDVEIPRIASDLGRELHFVKLPNFLSVETRPFDEDNYEDEIDEEETLDEEGRARLKLKVENTLRWRESIDKQGETIKQSNARLVKWSDGSMSLHLGSEIFDVHKQPLMGDHNHLFVRQGTGLQGQAVFRTKLSFRPHSTESFTHRKMTLSLADRSTKTPGIKILTLPVGRDPDQNRGQMIKKEEEKLRASVRRESKQKRVRERGAGGRLSAGYLEPDADGSDDEGAISINAIKNKHKRSAANAKGESRQPIYSSDEEGSDFETRRGKKSEHARALKDSDDSESNASDGSGSGGGTGARSAAASDDDD